MSAPVNVGDVLAGKYLVERVLGAGGMGVVVAARHLQLDERVAIKFLLPESLQNPGLVARFLREGRLAAKIRSDHVARVRDVGTLETGAPYLVLEYLDGVDLQNLIEKHGPLPIEAAVEYILQVCEALAEAHLMGIIHRDLKPANLFLTSRPDSSACVKLIDFGISKLAAGAVGEPNLTATVEVRGSPFFMSPEQLMASPTLDARSDIWALGVTLHNLLTMALPFPATTMPELCGKILHADPVPLRAVRPGAPEALEAVVLCCLRKKAMDRYSSVAEFAAALAPFAPPLARLSVDRISKILNVPAPLGGTTTGAAAPLALDEGAGRLPYTTTIRDQVRAGQGAITPSETIGERTAAAAATWSRTGSAASLRRRPFLAFALAACLMAGVVAVVFVWGRGSSERSQASDNPVPAMTLDLGGRAEPGSSAPDATAAPPSVSPSGTVPGTLETSAPVASVSAALIAIPAAPPTPSVRASGAQPRSGASGAEPALSSGSVAPSRPTATAPATSSKPVKPKSGDDLFNESL